MADGKTLEMLIKIAADQAIKTVTTLSGDLKTLAEQAAKVGGGTNVAAASLAQVQSAASRASQSFKLFGTSAEEIRRLQSQVKEAALDLTQNGFAPESDQVQELVSKYKELGKQADSEEGLFGAFSKLKTEIGSLAVVMAAVKVDQFVGKLGSYALEQADTMQTIKNNFGIMLNDMDAGAALAEKVNSFNVKTPFNLEQVSTATQVLHTAKVSLGDMEQYLTRFGDLAKGNAQQFASFTNAYAKGAAKGKADMEVLNVFAEQGIPIYDALAAQMDTTSDKIAEMSSKGQISFRDLDAAIKQMTDQGGGYYGTMELASQSWESAQAGLKESCNALASSIGQMLMPAMQTLVSWITSTVNAINDSPVMKGVLLGALTAVVLVINTQAIRAIVALVAKVWAAFAAQMSYTSALSITNPLLLAGIAAVGVATAAYAVYASQQQQTANATNEAALAARQQAEDVQNLTASYDTYIKTLKDASDASVSFNLDQNQQELVKAQSELASLKSRKHSANPFAPTTFTVSGSETEMTTAGEDIQKQIDAAQKRVDLLVKAIAADQNEIAERAKNKAADIAAKLADFGTDWQDKNLTGIDAIRREQENAQATLAAKAAKDLGDNWQTAKAYKDELAALDLYYENKITLQKEKDIEDAAKKAKEQADAVAKVTGAGWTDKINAGSVIDEYASIDEARRKSQAQLDSDALKAYGINYQTQSDYQAQSFALQKYYDQQIDDAKKQALLSEHEDAIKAYKEEAEYRMALAEHNLKTGSGDTLGNLSDYSSAYIQQQTADTNIGEAAAAGGGTAGFTGEVMTQFGKALVDALLALDNVNKTLNFVNTIVDSMFVIIGPMLNDLFKPLVDCLETIGKVLGKVLAPIINTIAIILLPLQTLLKGLEVVLQLVGAAFTWLNNKVIVPVGNTIINVINGIIDLLNKIPYVDIEKISTLQLVGEEAEAAAEALADAEEEIKKKYQRQEDAVNDLLNAQISSLQSQYELGLISRSDYESQAEAYHEAADTQVDSIEEEMNAALKAIEENTGTMSQTESDTKSGLENFFGNIGSWFSNLFSGLGSWFASAGSSIGDFFSGVGSSIADTAGTIWTGIVDTAQNIGDAVAGVATKVWDGVTDAAAAVGDWVSSWWPFDNGTTNVPADHVSIVHKGESIIPKSFADGIKSGDMALVGSSGSGSSSGNTYIITMPLTVTGSVVTEKQLVDVVYEGISDAISSGGKTALPTEAA